MKGTVSLTFGRQFKEARLRTGLSQSGLSRLVGVSQGEISKIEAGKWNPTLLTLERLMFEMDCELVIQAREVSR